MCRSLIVMFTFLILLTGCSSENEELRMNLERISEEYEDNLDAKQAELLVLQTDIDDTNKTYEDSILKYLNDISVLEDKIRELEEALQKEENTAFHKSRYNMITEYSNGRIGMGYNPEYFELYANLMIIGYGEFDLIKHEVLDLSGAGEASLKIDIAGELYNFKLGYIEWDSEYKKFSMSKVVYDAPKISNTSLLFTSLLAEGIPNEAIIWTNKTGKEFSYLIGDNSLRGDTFPYIIISELLE